MKFHRSFDIDIKKLNEAAIELIKTKAKRKLASLKKEYEDESGEKKDIDFYEVYVFVDGKEMQLFKYETGYDI